MTYRFVPDSIVGWTSQRELQYLFMLAVDLERRGVKGKLLEIGSYRGRSACALLQAGELWCVDTFEGGGGVPETTPKEGLDAFDANLKSFFRDSRASGKLHVKVGRSEDALNPADLFGYRFRLVFVDGGHDYDTVKKDIELSWNLLVPGGAMVLDDFEEGFPGVLQAGQEAGFIPVTGTKFGVRMKSLTEAPLPETFT